MRRFASVNAWIVGPMGRQFIIDTGMCGADTEQIWRRAEESGELGGVEAILVTHMHRDHAGQVRHLQQRFGAKLLMSAREHAGALAASMAIRDENRLQLCDFLLALGMDGQAADAIAPIDYSMLAPFPLDFIALQDDGCLSLAGRNWRVMLGGGHSAAAACLMAEDKSLFFSGDQVLAGAGAHIAVWQAAPEADPLADYFTFLDRLAPLPDEMLVLPGHGLPFRGLAAQARSLRRQHEDRLAKLANGIFGAMSCVEMAPLVFSDRAIRRFAELIPAMTLSLANHLWHRAAFAATATAMAFTSSKKHFDSRSR